MRNCPLFIARFWSRVLVRPSTASCWPWIGAFKDVDGYGITTFNKRSIRTHRVAYELTYGAPTKGLLVLHKCDNPECCNPTHLSLGTTADNMRDRNKKRRCVHGSEHYAHKINEDQAREIKRRFRARSKGPDGSYALSKEFGISRTIIYHIVQGRKWKHI